MALATEMLVETLTARPKVTRTATTTETMTDLGWRLETATIAPVPTRDLATGFPAGWAGSER